MEAENQSRGIIYRPFGGAPMARHCRPSALAWDTAKTARHLVALHEDVHSSKGEFELEASWYRSKALTSLHRFPRSSEVTEFSVERLLLSNLLSLRVQHFAFTVPDPDRVPYVLFTTDRRRDIWVPNGPNVVAFALMHEKAFSNPAFSIFVLHVVRKPVESVARRRVSLHPTNEPLDACDWESVLEWERCPDVDLVVVESGAAKDTVLGVRHALLIYQLR